MLSESKSRIIARSIGVLRCPRYEQFILGKNNNNNNNNNNNDEDDANDSDDEQEDDVADLEHHQENWLSKKLTFVFEC